MVDSQPQDWRNYWQIKSNLDAEQLCSLTPDERLRLCEELSSKFRDSLSDEEWQRFQEWHWEQEVAGRLRMVEAFRKLDEHLRNQGMTLADVSAGRMKKPSQGQTA